MLSVEEKEEIEKELEKGPTRVAAALEGLKIVQRHRGWVADDGLADLAAYLKLSPDLLDSLATYYNLIFREEVGRHLILICDGMSCWVTGYEDIREVIAAKLGVGLGQTTPDGRFTLLPSVCLGLCEQAPVMIIDNNIHGDLTSEKINQILESYK
jgi:NADH-quinone oxidoreductase subunit E